MPKTCQTSLGHNWANNKYYKKANVDKVSIMELDIYMNTQKNEQRQGER